MSGEMPAPETKREEVLSATMAPTAPPAAPGTKPVEELTSKDYYFDSYSHFGIHEEMLKDTVRTKTYMQSMLNNKHLFKGKVVLDVGCGTGILSMFASQAGAKHVYGVDCSSIIEKAKEIVALNGFAEKITLIQGKVEEVTLPVDKVDIIISEWMGYFLLYESMLDTVLVARDKWLAEGGSLFPDKATMYMTAIEDAEYKEEKIAFWDNVYGFDMSPIKKVAMLEPLVDTVSADSLVADSHAFYNIDINTVTISELTFDRSFRITFNSEDYCHAVVAYFDVEFSASHKSLKISTGPEDEYTHWKQTVFYLDEALPVVEGDVLEGRIVCKPNASNKRDLDIDIDFKFTGSVTAEPKEWSQTFNLR